MKKIIQLLLLPIFLFVSCISENMDDCPATRTLFFTHHCLYDSDESFDRWIGNDVMLYVFQDKVLRTKELIPYEQIKDGAPYAYTKDFGGDIDIVAWAVPKGASTAIPQYDYGERLNDKYVTHEMGATNYNTFPVDLYLGVDSVKDDKINRASKHTIPMIHCACLIDITVNDPSNVLSAFSDHSIQVNGVMNKMNLQYYGIGQEATVMDVVNNTGSYWSSGIFGILPSADNQTLTFTLYGDSKPLAVITTDQKAMAGGKIELSINMNLTVNITVNNSDWVVYAVVEWM